MASDSDDAIWKDRSKHFVNLVDIIFAVIIAQSFIALSDSVLPLQLTTFNFFTLIVAYLTIILSWVGYHESINLQHHRSWLRFALDLVILPVYLLLVNRFDDVGVFLLAFTILIILYLSWGVVKAWEYPKKKGAGCNHRPDYYRYLLRLPYLPLVILVWLFYEAHIPQASILSLEIRGWISIAILGSIAILYRFQPTLRLLKRRKSPLAKCMEIEAE